MRPCDAKSKFGGREITCTLPIGHGGVHALRNERSRKEFTTIAGHKVEDVPTVVYETIATWPDGADRARPYSIQRTGR